MAFYRCGGGGIPSSLKTDMNAVFNKKFGTAVDYPPEGWPDTVNLMGPLPEKTIVSWPIADFNDGADDVPTKSLVVTIAPTLSGVSTITEKQTGRNLADGTNFTRGLPSTTIGASIETITASTRYAYIGIDAKGTNYTISSVSTDTDYFNTILIYGYTNGVLSVYTNTAVNASKTVDFSACDYIRLAIGTRSASYQVPTDLTEYGTIQLEIGSTAHAYEPYTTPTVYTASLGRTIYGGTADIVNGVGSDGYGYVDLGSLTWTKRNTSSGHWRFTTQDVPVIINDDNSHVPDMDCGSYTAISPTQSYNGVTGVSCNTGISQLMVCDEQYETASDFKTAVNGVYLVYPLATPTDFTFTGQEIPTILGYNAFWSDQGDTEVTYRADISLALGGQ